jgi:3-polyprenyl-4-hydroxybenzoate decarboxylase
VLGQDALLVEQARQQSQAGDRAVALGHEPATWRTAAASPPPKFRME